MCEKDNQEPVKASTGYSPIELSVPDSYLKQFKDKEEIKKFLEKLVENIAPCEICGGEGHYAQEQRTPPNFESPVDDEEVYCPNCGGNKWRQDDYV